MVPNAQTNHERMLACEALFRHHIEQEVIKIQYLTSLMIDFMLTKLLELPSEDRSTIFAFMVTHTHIYMDLIKCLL